MDWDKRLATLYKCDPHAYFDLARKPWTEGNPQSLQLAMKGYEPLLGEHAFPCYLWVMAKKYYDQGLGQIPDSTSVEDAVYRHAVNKDTVPGPVKDSVVALSDMHEKAFEFLGSDKGAKRLRAFVTPVFETNSRLKGILDAEDLSQETLALAYRNSCIGLRACWRDWWQFPGW